jgi:hypothetical protein
MRARVDCADEAVGGVCDKKRFTSNNDAAWIPKSCRSADSIGCAGARAAGVAAARQRGYGARRKRYDANKVIRGVSDVDDAARRIHGEAARHGKKSCRAHGIDVASRRANDGAAAGNRLHHAAKHQAD